MNALARDFQVIININYRLFKIKQNYHRTLKQFLNSIIVSLFMRFCVYRLFILTDGVNKKISEL
jgi:hypothetical protein